MDVLTPRTLDEALRLKAERPDAVPIQGGTDVMVELNFDRARPPALLEPERGRRAARAGRARTARSGSAPALTYAEAMEAPLAEALPALAEASRTVGSPQIRNRGTIGGNLGTASPAGDALPPLLVEGAEVEARERARRARRAARRVPRRAEAERARAGRADRRRAIVEPSGAPADVHEGRAAERDGDRRLSRSRSPSTASAASCARRSARPGRSPALVTAPLDDATAFPERVAAAASPIDDVRGTAAYRRHALRVLTKRALERCLA